MGRFMSPEQMAAINAEAAKMTGKEDRLPEPTRKAVEAETAQFLRNDKEMGFGLPSVMIENNDPNRTQAIDAEQLRALRDGIRDVEGPPMYSP